MPERDDVRAPAAHQPVPDLIDRYRTQRQEWLCRADELVRLREEVRTAAEREAAEIVTTARRNVRRVILDARRELLALSQQVEAALGPFDVTAAAATAREFPAVDPEPTSSEWQRNETSDVLMGAHLQVRDVLEEARAEIQALSAATADVRGDFPADAAPAPIVLPPRIDAKPHRRRRVLILSVLAAGASVLAGWMWQMATDPFALMLPKPPTTPPHGVIVELEQPRIAPESPPRPEPPVPAPPSLLIEARRPVWIRATVDGRTDTERTLHAGETRRIRDARVVVLRVGDAGAVYVSLHGGRAEVFGRDGEVLTRRFTLERIATPAARDAATSIAPIGEVPTSSASGLSEMKIEAPQSAFRAAADAVPQPGPLVQPVPQAAGAAAVSGTSSVGPMTSPAAATVAQTQGSPNTAAIQAHIVAAAEEWLDSYHRRDHTIMAALATTDVAVSDERGPHERVPEGSEVRRVLDQVHVELAGNAATLTAAMTEQPSGDGRLELRASRISQTWLLEAGQWRLMQARIISDRQFKQVARPR